MGWTKNKGGQKMSKSDRSIEDKRKSLLEAMSQEGIERTIPKRNDDLKNFLEKHEEKKKGFKNIRFIVE